MTTGTLLPVLHEVPRIPDKHAEDDVAYRFELDPRVTDPAAFRVAFCILLDGDLVMTPEHLGVAFMTAVLRRAGYTARILEVVRGEEGAALHELEAFEPHLTCFTLMSLNVESCLRFCAQLRERLPATTIAAGGPAGTYAGMDILRTNPHVDIVAIGEGEPTIFDLARSLVLGEDLAGCPGICYRAAGGTLHRNRVRALIHDLDVLPFPARDQLELHGSKLEYVRVSTSRGCVARCTFCSAPNISNRVQRGKAWRGMSAERVLDELTDLVHTYNFRTYDFIDSTFEDPDGGPQGKARIATIAGGIIERGLDIYYNCCMRAENWSDDDHELLELLIRSGLEKVNIGIEAGNETDLRLWEKRATVEDNVRVIRLLREHGLYLAMGFIQFHPYSTVETLKQNAGFLRDHAGHNLRRLTERLEVYPGTVIIARMERDGLLGERYWETQNPYDYSFEDEAVGRLAVHYASLYNNPDYYERGVITEQSSVFRFETFNVVLQTFIMRCSRRFRHIPGAADVLDDFKRTVHAIRQEMGAFNYAFFMENLEDVLADRADARKRDRQVEEIERYYAQRIEQIRAHQLRCGRALIRLGADVAQIRSTIPPEQPGGAARNYTGSNPCW